MNDAIRPQPGIMDIALYEGGKAAVPGVTNILKLSSNENPFGASDKAKEAFLRSVHQLHRYPSPITPTCARRLPRCMGWMRRG